MKNCNAEEVKNETKSQTKAEESLNYPAYIGLDVHSQSIAIAVARAGREEPEFRCEIANKPKCVEKLIRHLTTEYAGEVLLFCYEAGVCGYGLHRQIVKSGHDCHVVAPSKIPNKPGDRIKTDRRDACKLAHYLRSGDLTPVWIPGEEQESMRDLVRARADFKSQEQKARLQLNHFVLRHGHVWPTRKQRWNQTHYNWLESLKFPHDWQQIVLQEYIDAVKAASRRVADIMAEIERVLPQWSMAPVVYSLMSLRGVNTLTAVAIMAELGDITRFDSPTQLMSYVGLVPIVHASGSTKRMGRITRTGNSHVRRLLVESAWTYRFAARQTGHIKRKARNASDKAKATAWKAQKRLCGRYRSLMLAGKSSKVTAVAIARELLGFIWEIVCQEMPKIQQAA
jgi:transposase